MKKKGKNIAIIVGIILIIGALVSFGIAIGVGCNTKRMDNKVQVYVNDNDTVIEQLQSDVKHLTEILNKVQNDSIVVTINHVSKENPHSTKSED